jgi:hypothetical protein
MASATELCLFNIGIRLFEHGDRIVKGIIFAIDYVGWLVYWFFNSWSKGTVCLINCAVIGSWCNIEWTKIEIRIGVGPTIEMKGVAVKAVFR